MKPNILAAASVSHQIFPGDSELFHVGYVTPSVSLLKGLFTFEHAHNTSMGEHPEDILIGCLIQLFPLRSSSSSAFPAVEPRHRHPVTMERL